MWQNPCKTNWKYQPCTDFCSVVVVAFFIHSDAFVTIFYWMFLAIFTANRFQVVLYFMLCTFFLKKKPSREKSTKNTRLLHSILQKRPLATNASRKDTDRVFVLILFTYFFCHVFSHCTGMAERNIFPILFSCHITKFTRFARLIEHVQPAKTTMKTYDCQMCMCSNACYFYKFIIITD